MINLVMPMAGGGTRFKNNEIDIPKPLIEINEKPFFFWAAQSILKFIEIENHKYGNVKGKNKRSRIYEYYKKSENHKKFEDNIREAFEKLYTEENIKELYSKIEQVLKKTHLKSIVREFYKNEIIGESEFSKKNGDGISILYNQIKDSIKKEENFIEFIENIGNLELKDLTKSQIFYSILSF